MGESELELIRFNKELRGYTLAMPFALLDLLTTIGERIAIFDNLQAVMSSSTVGAFPLRYGFHLIHKNQIVSVQVHEMAQT